MSWRRDEGRFREEHGSRGRSPVWEPRRSPSPRRPPSPRRRDESRERSRRDRYDRDRRRDSSRDRRRPRYDDRDIPSAPSPPRISDVDKEDSRSSTHSRDFTQETPNHDAAYDQKSDKSEQDTQNQVVNVSPGDWYCKCGSYNFKRRHICYRRHCDGKRSEGTIYGDVGSGGADSYSGITKRLLLRRLDALTTEEKILDSLKEICTKTVIDSIGGITIGRETLTGASKCLAYINFNSIADSTAAFKELMSMKSPLVIDNREVIISYYNEPKPKTVNPSADYSAYYAQAAAYTHTNSLSLSEADRVNAAAAVAQSAISAAQARQMWAPLASANTSSTVQAVSAPTGDGKTKYTAPDTQAFLYDETSGYYYDPSTGLYYDSNTQYFFNNLTNQYMYWDAKSSTYISATQQSAAEQSFAASSTENKTVSAAPPEEKKKKDKEDKVKVAKKIAKDMERWAKTLNQKKENAKSNIVQEQIIDAIDSKGSADIGFSVLGAGPSHQALNQSIVELSPPPRTEEFLMKTVAEPVQLDNDDGIIDWSKLTCLLCKRRFPSADVLTKHKTMSDLHKQNLVEFHKQNEPQNNSYRDRAAERRMKFGENEPAPIRKRYEPQESMPPPISHPPPSVVDTIGGKMLQKMGWSQGRGLGKEEQGRIAPIEAEQRPNLAGLGRKGIYTPTPGETYRDTMKKLMIARYREVAGQDEEA